LEARLKELDNRHRKLDRTIETETNSPSASDLRIRELKRQKLRLKEEIEGLKSRGH
jgi:hypothetical protein